MCRPAPPTGGLINPSMFPVPSADPGVLTDLAQDLRAEGSTISGLGSDIKSSWAGLSSCYSAPEAETLYAVVDPVPVDGDKVETSYGSAATALETFADKVNDIKGKWRTLTTDANDFLASIEGDEDWREADGIAGWFGAESDKVEEHQALLDRADALRQEYQQAEIDCANSINAGLPDRTVFVLGNGEKPTPEDGVFEHGYDGYLGDVPMVWGGPVETDYPWWVDAGSAVKDYTVGIVEDIGGMTGMYSSEGWFEMSWGDALMEYHGENLQSLGSLVGMYNEEEGGWGWSGWDTVGNAWKDAAHAVVPWEEWGDRPGYVIGTALLNIGATVGGALLTATGVGAVVGVPLMAWRGSAMLNRMGGDGPSVPDVNVPDLSRINLNLPRFGNFSFADLNIDLSQIRQNSFSLPQLSEMRDLLSRLTGQNVIDAGGGNGSGGDGSEGIDSQNPNFRQISTNPGDDGSPTGDRPRVDPTTQNLADADRFMEIVNNPENAGFGQEINQRYQNEIAENDRDAKTRPGGSQGSWEANEIESDRPDDGFENEPALVRVGGDDTLEAEADAPRNTNDQVIGDRSDLSSTDNGNDGGLNDRFDEVVGDQFGNGPQMRDQNPTVVNSNGGNGTDPVNGNGGSGGNTDVLNSTGNGGSTSSTGDTRTGSAGGDLTGGGGNQNGGGNSRNGGSQNTPITDQPELHRGDTNDPRVQRLLPGDGLRFGEYRDANGDVQNHRLEENSRYVVVEEGGKLRTEYLTDAEGNIREIRTESEGWNSKHPEYLNPRPDMTYNVDGYTYRTDEYSRTVSVEGTLHKEPNVRNEDEQSKVNSQGSDYYQQLNEKIRNDFETAHGRPPNPGEVPQYQDIQWDGGHLIGYAEFFGIGERLNQVPMRYDVNQNRTDTALDDIPADVRGGIEGSYRNIERSWRGIMNHGSSWHNFNNPKFNDGTWANALALNPRDPKIEVRITNTYDPDMPLVPDPNNPGQMLPPPPSRIEASWTLNGVKMKTQTYNNVPPLVD